MRTMRLTKHLDLQKRACISYWWPRLKASGVAAPNTEIITTTAEMEVLLEYDEPEGISELIQSIRFAGDALGWPCFLRSGHTSAKHQWEKSCFLPNREAILDHLRVIVEESALSCILGLPTEVWAVREMLPVMPAFHAFEGMPIGRERRYFFEGGAAPRILKHLPYWPEDAFLHDSLIRDEACGSRLPHPERASIAESPHGDELWRLLLARENEEPPAEIAYLTAVSLQVARQFEGCWSVDWLMTDHGWYAIDMAPAELSWGWKEE